MKTSVIICEFNPLHYGHKKLIDFAKTFSDKVICVMSGNFVQRGMPACCNKYKRALHAIRAGADLVVELPTVFSTASAENFAFGGVSVANKLGVDYLVFGSECGDISTLQNCLTLLNDPIVNAKIKENLSLGYNYPKAVASAIGTDILDKPNNVLGVEYLRALKNTDSQITPVTIKREDNYNSAPQVYASSSVLRNQPSLREKFTFDFVCTDINDNIENQYCEFATHFLALQEKRNLENIAGITEGLHNRIFVADKTQGFEKMMEYIKTKRYTRLKLQRIVLNCLLGITKEQVRAAKLAPPKIKVLAVSHQSTQLLDGLENLSDEITQRADRLYSTFDHCPPPAKLEVW